VERLAAKHEHATVVSGGARGVDQTAESAARLAGLRVISYRVRKRDDGFIVVRLEAGTTSLVEQGHRTAADALKSRNTLIVDEADHVIAFHDGKSRGTADAIAKAEQAGKLSRAFTNEELVLRELERGVREGWLEPVA
jgi:hypothetical protein